ncbi:nuclease-related domain-containing protein [Basfia succiniciproducens]|uniref:nuclease-related domain-containing protein n=1 Tax=Basfia succiniciproducens TaxID=653940 RepID=UPI003FCC59CB
MANQMVMAFWGRLWEFLTNLWWLPLALLFLAFLKSRWFKGRFGEKAIQSRLSGLDKKVYRPFHDLIVPSHNTTTQIDHIYVSCFGIFVVETKNYSGWIFGSEKQARWTQTIYRKKHSFQNPLRQNYAHIKALASLLELPESVFHSVVVFLGGCEFKTQMPENVCYIGQAERYIRNIQTVMLDRTEVDRICTILQNKKYAANNATRVAHKNNLRQRHQSYN